MKKARLSKAFHKSFIYLDDALFKDDGIRAKSIIQVFQIFSIDTNKFKASAFVDIDDNFIESIRNAIYSNSIYVEKEAKRGRGYRKIVFEFSGNYISEIVEKAILHDVTVEGEVFWDSREDLLQFVINDHDGTCIRFDNEYYANLEIEQSLQLMNLL